MEEAIVVCLLIVGFAVWLFKSLPSYVRDIFWLIAVGLFLYYLFSSSEGEAPTSTLKEISDKAAQSVRES